jgi:hypothetical protein
MIKFAQILKIMVIAESCENQVTPIQTGSQTKRRGRLRKSMTQNLTQAMESDAAG